MCCIHISCLTFWLSCGDCTGTPSTIGLACTYIACLKCTARNCVARIFSVNPLIAGTSLFIGSVELPTTQRLSHQPHPSTSIQVEHAVLTEQLSSSEKKEFQLT